MYCEIPVKVELPPSPLSLATLPLSLATLTRHSSSRHSPSPLSLAPPWGHASPDGFASYTAPSLLPGAPPTQHPPLDHIPPCGSWLMRQQLGRQRGGQRDARLDARIRQVHREDELLPNRAHAIRRTQSGAQSDVITHLQVERTQSGARNQAHAIRRHHAPASRASRRRPRH